MRGTRPLRKESAGCWWSAGSIRPEDLAAALREQERGDARGVGEILVSMGACRQQDVLAAQQVLDARSREAGADTVRVGISLLDDLMNLVGELVLARNQLLQFFGIARGGFDQQFWLPMLACAAVIVGLELLYRYTLVGRAFLAISEDNYAARALGLPERGLRMASFALAGVIGTLAALPAARCFWLSLAMLRFSAFYGFVPVALGGMGNNRGAVVAGLLLGLFQQAANFRRAAFSRRWRSSRCSFLFCWRVLRGSWARLFSVGFDGCGGTIAPEPCQCVLLPESVWCGAALPGAVRCRHCFAIVRWRWCWGVIVTRACVYWVLVSGLNLVVGFAGQIAIGWVALLTLGAYTTSVLAAGNVMPAFSPYLALAIAAVVGAIFGLIIGLPALRLRTFYFAITTLGFATIVTQVAFAWQSVTGGGVGVPGLIFPEPFSSQWGFYYFCFGLAAICTWMTANVAASRFGRALAAIRDAEVAAEASGISKPALLGAVFMFSGAVAAVAGGLFAALQSYITPDAFTLDLSILFFIAILIGGRGSILGPLLGTILLTALPEFAAPLVASSTFLYAVLLPSSCLRFPAELPRSWILRAAALSKASARSSRGPT